MVDGATWTWRDSPSPRDLIPNEADIPAMFKTWLNEPGNEIIRDMHGVQTLYRREPDLYRYRSEPNRAHRYNNLPDSNSSGIAQAFWLWMQERTVRDMGFSTEGMDAEIAAEFRSWNISAGKRTVNGLVLPWRPENVEMIIDGTLGKRGTKEVKEAVSMDTAHFLAYRRALQAEGGVAMPSVLPLDLDAPVEVTDPRVHHVWVEAADISRETGMCATYDVMARKANVPNRAQLKAAGELQVYARLMFRGTVNIKVLGQQAATDPHTAAANMTGAQIRAEINKMTDDQVKALFQFHDYKTVV